jgi:gamma-glutamyltranspeptidase/glutathione hydrolase
MSRQQVIQPAINHARRGVLVSDVLSGMITEHYDVLATFPASEQIYLTDGFPKAAGERVANTDLADTLQLIAEQGSDAFYHGPVAQSIVDAVQADGGLITLDDLATYEVSFRPPVSSTYRDYEIISAPPPSSGGAHVIYRVAEHHGEFRYRDHGFQFSRQPACLGGGNEVGVCRPCHVHG